MTYRNILVPLDGSHFAEAALPYARRLARSARARIHLVMVHEPVAALVGMGETPPLVELDEESRNQERSYLASLSGELIHQGLPMVEFRDLEGAPGPVLCEEAERLGVDLVVMATHGRGAMGRLWLGSVADYLVRHLAAPVLLVHPDRKEPSEAPPLHSVLVALDLSKESEAILGPVVTLAQATDGYVTLVHVLEPVIGPMGLGMPFVPAAPPELFAEQRELAQHQLDLIADRLREQGVSVRARILTAASPATGLLETLAQDAFDLLAITTHGRGGLRRLLLGSVADKVIRAADKAVLAVRPPPRDEGC